MMCVARKELVPNGAMVVLRGHGLAALEGPARIAMTVPCDAPRHQRDMQPWRAQSSIPHTLTSPLQQWATFGACGLSRRKLTSWL